MAGTAAAVRLPERAHEPHRAGLRAAIPKVLVVVGVVAAIIVFATHRDLLEQGTLETRIEALGAWGPVVFVAFYAVGTVAFLPGSLLTVAGGALFGPVLGAVLSLLGATLGATASFAIARYLAADAVSRRAGPKLRVVLDGVKERGWRFVAFVRLVPLLPFNALNYVLGLTPIGLGAYVVTSLVCMAPGAIVYTWLGHAGRSLASGGAGSVKLVLIAVGLLGALALVPSLLRRRGVSKSAVRDTDG